MSRFSISLRAGALVWVSFFALNVVLSAAFCKELRAAPATRVARTAAESYKADAAAAVRVDFQAAYGESEPTADWDHDSPAPLPQASAPAKKDHGPTTDTGHTGHHGNGAIGEADCEFCLLVGVADTSQLLVLTPSGLALPTPVFSAHAAPNTADTRQHPIRAPPLS